MKKAFLIVVAVVAYSVLETGLLLSSIIFHEGVSYPSTYQAAVYWGQLLLIPGLAALFSRIMYGSYRWRSRTLTILLAGLLSVPIGITVLVIVLVPLGSAFGTSRILFYLLLLVSLICVVFGLFIAKQKSEKWGVKAEGARWLAERQSGVSSREMKWRNRGIRLATCFPALLVLLIFLFLPELWGMLSHLSWPKSGSLSGYNVPIPATWIVLQHQNQAPNGWSVTSGLAGRGVWRGGSPYLRGPLPFFSWSIWTRGRDETAASMSPQWGPKDDEIIGQRVFTIGSDNISCVEHKPSYLALLYNRWGETHIDCSDPGRFYASFAGPKPQVETFYEVLGGITQ